MKGENKASNGFHKDDIVVCEAKTVRSEVVVRLFLQFITSGIFCRQFFSICILSIFYVLKCNISLVLLSNISVKVFCFCHVFNHKVCQL